MFTHHIAKGIILSTFKIRDADEVFVLYTFEFGKLEVLGRSIRKGGSKLRASMSLFSYVEIEFIEGKNYNTLTDAKLICSFNEAKENLGKLSLLFRISETTLSLISEEKEEDEDIFYFLLKSFQKINKLSFSQNDLKIFFCFYSFNLLYFLGYKLYTEKCVFCGFSKIRNGYFSPLEGGVICENCFCSNNTKERVATYKEKAKENFVCLEDVSMLENFLKSDIESLLGQDPSVCTSVLESYISCIPKKKASSN